jgi:SagB-type dehydrogenase family enzyme
MVRGQARLHPRHVDLPEVAPDAGLSLERALRGRPSVRAFADRPLALAEIAPLLFAAQGITDAEGFRTAPSAGATYALELHLVAGRVDALPAGVWHHEVPRERLLQEVTGDRRRALARAALGQAWLAEAPAVLVISAVPERTTRRYGARGERYVHMEVGHAAQNLCLMARALALGATVVGAFEDAAVAEVLGLPAERRPLCLLPVGYPAGAG